MLCSGSALIGFTSGNARPHRKALTKSGETVAPKNPQGVKVHLYDSQGCVCVCVCV